ncbi:Ig-like domain-containing protein [Nocardioides campestrisoli]|uniref:Ig-like domain-containing protein n=1 Tax=Nocardioides campestrisoli TaxID=2736757 RepID=UPI0015E6E8BD|nr:Ig-like domain-containing protein [Nocardioides campestrisoli]
MLTNHARRSRRARRISLLVTAGLVGLGTLNVASAAQAAEVASPGALEVQLRNSSTPVLSWARAAGASTYQVQVDDDPGFGSPGFTVTTANNRAVPSGHLRPGVNHWRVRSVAGKQTSAWRSSQLAVSPVDVPVLTYPARDAVLQQPQTPPLLRWQTSRGATSYIVEVDGDADFIGANSYTTQTTSLVVPDPLTEGDYFWRVTAVKAKGLNSAPSAESRFVIAALPAPVLTYPVDSVDAAVGDVELDWEPVPGAATYDVQIALDRSFNNYAHTATKIRGTRYSPSTTLANDQYWWRVRAVDAFGQTSAWRETVFSFKREWLDQPQPVHPLGTPDAPSAVGPDDQYYQWTPVRFASYYELVVARDRNFSVGVETCEVLGTTYVPRGGDCSFSTGTQYWQVRAIDLPYRNGLPGVLSPVRAFTWTPPELGTWSGRFAPVTGQTVAMTGQGARTGKSCSAKLCTEVGATPVLTWDRQPGVTHYQVYFAQDPQFTTTELQPILTTNNMVTVHRRDKDVDALPDSAVGLPYNWYVRPCVNRECGPSPVSQREPLPGTFAFAKVSPAVAGLTSSDPAGTDITFRWQDYLTTNLAQTFMGETGTQSARSYRIQVDDESSFSKPLVDESVVDQTTYTAYNKLYPEGRLYWRVQAIDGEGNTLTWSSVNQLVKSSPPVELASPTGGAAVAGTAPFEWRAQAWANQYTVEVYRNGDTTFSSANRIFSVTTRSASYAYAKPIPASSAPYVWRVRRIDSDGNVGPWSATGSFYSTGTAPELLSPAGGSLQAPSGVLLEWSDVQGAASYRGVLDSGGKPQTFNTVATAHAPSTLPTGSYTWTVQALDSDGAALGTSASRTFSVDASAPALSKVTPKKLKAKSTVKLTFSEPVQGISQKTVKLKVEKAAKKKAKKGKKSKAKVKYKTVKAKVKATKGSLVVTVDPKGKLRSGQYVLLLDTKRIRDAAGNALDQKYAQVRLRR